MINRIVAIRERHEGQKKLFGKTNLTVFKILMDTKFICLRQKVQLKRLLFNSSRLLHVISEDTRDRLVCNKINQSRIAINESKNLVQMAFSFGWCGQTLAVNRGKKTRLANISSHVQALLTHSVSVRVSANQGGPT